MISQLLDKKCPFCGSNAIIIAPSSYKIGTYTYWSIICTNENCKLNYIDMSFITESDAKIFWNHRVN